MKPTLYKPLWKDNIILNISLKHVGSKLYFIYSMVCVYSRFTREIYIYSRYKSEVYSLDLGDGTWSKQPDMPEQR